MKDNELIAEFMGIKLHDGMAVFDPTFNEPPEELQYNTSWDWLMPVVDKIDKMTLTDETYFRTNINGSRNRTHCFIYKYHPGESVGRGVSEGHEDSKLDSVYKAVVEFIKWYNTKF